MDIVAERGRRSRGGNLCFVWSAFQCRLRIPSRPWRRPPLFRPGLEQTSMTRSVTSTSFVTIITIDSTTVASVPNLGVNYPNLVMGPFDLGNGLFFLSLSLLDQNWKTGTTIALIDDNRGIKMTNYSWSFVSLYFGVQPNKWEFLRKKMSLLVRNWRYGIANDPTSGCDLWAPSTERFEREILQRLFYLFYLV